MDKDQIIQEMRQVGATWQEIADRLGYNNGEQVRSYARYQNWYKDLNKHKSRYDKIQPIEYTKDKISKQITLSDGSISSSIRQKLLEQKTFTNDELLEIHGFDKDEFEIKTVTSNEWSMTNGAGEKYYNFQSKIIAKPRDKSQVRLERIEEILNNLKPLPLIEKTKDIKNDYLLIPLYDIHFGLNDYEYYFNLQNEIIDKIRNTYKEILIVIGGDLLHVDNFNNTTAKGTQLETVDFEKMIEDAEMFLLNICSKAIEYSKKTKLVYLPGNHADSNDYLLTRSISKLLPQIKSDYSINEYKHSWLGKHSIFMHHGDKRKNSQKLLEVMVSMYAKEWGESKSRYLITGHFHHEKTFSNAGMTHYQVMSPSKSTEYEERYGYISSESGLMLFEFNEDKRKAVYYL